MRFFLQGGVAFPATLNRKSENTRASSRRGFHGDSRRLAGDSHRNASGGDEIVCGWPPPGSRLSQAHRVLEPLEFNQAVSSGVIRPKHPAPALREPRGTLTRTQIDTANTLTSVTKTQTSGRGSGNVFQSKCAHHMIRRVSFKYQP